MEPPEKQEPMRHLKKQERAAIEGVARRFSASRDKGSSPRDAYIRLAGKRVALEVVTLKACGTGQSNTAKPRLRFDKVATGLIERLQAPLGEILPDGMTLLLTITAPIHAASKTAASLTDNIQTLLERRSPGRDKKNTIYGNRVQIRLLKDKSKRAPKMIGFVHNPESDARVLLNMACELLEPLNVKGGRRVLKRGGDRWLVMISARGISCLDAYRYIYSQLRPATNFKRALMVFNDEQVGMLTR